MGDKVDVIHNSTLVICIIKMFLELQRKRELMLQIVTELRSQDTKKEKIEYLQIRGESDDLCDLLRGDEVKLKRILRTSPESFKVIVQHVGYKRHGYSVEYEVICFLYWLASGCSYREVGRFMGVSRYTVRDLIHRMLEFFSSLGHLINHGTVDDYDRLTKKFCKRGNSQAFKKCIGAIDGMDVKIKCPKNQEDAYLNHKGFYSYKVQAVANSDGVFTSVFIGFPGSVNVARVLKKSPLYASGEYPPAGYYLLSDKAYPCITNPVTIIAPFKTPRNEDEKKYNAAHNSAWNVVECSLTILKERWKNIFNSELTLNAANCVKTIYAAFILHNISVLNDYLDPYEIEVMEANPLEVIEEDPLAFIESEPTSPIKEKSISRRKKRKLNDSVKQTEQRDSEDGIKVRNKMFLDFINKNT